MNKTPMDCKTFQNELPDLVLTPNARPSLAAVAHLRACPPCSEEYLSFQSTFATLDRWNAPEPSAYFDQKLAVRMREEQAAPRMSWLERLRTRIALNGNHNLRPIMVGALALVLVASGGGIAGINYRRPIQPSAALNDLQILDRNEQAFQSLDELQQDDDSTQQNGSQPSSIDGNAATPVAPPAS
jgi:hypothetical protein